MDAQLQGGLLPRTGARLGASLPARILAEPPGTPPTFLGRFHFLYILNRSVNSHHSGH